MTERKKTWLAVVLAITALLPATAYAQRIPMIVIYLALIPVVNIVLSLVAGLVAWSWRQCLLHLGLCALWLGWFTITAWFDAPDGLIWLSIILADCHIFVLIVLILATAVKKWVGRSPNRRPPTTPS